MSRTVIAACLLAATGCAPAIRTMPKPAPEPIAETPLLAKSPDIIVVASETAYDPETGSISYMLPEPALVRIRIGVQNGPLLRTLVDWEPRAAGQHVTIWDRTDETGNISYLGRRDITVVITCIRPGEEAAMQPKACALGLRKSPEILISFPGESEQNTDGIPVVTGVVPVRIEVGVKEKAWLTNSQYEVAIYIDHVFVIEEEEGLSPFSYLLNTQGMNEGEHVITANVLSYDGEVGTRSARCYVRKGK
ncbi:hypothetical protein ACFL6M_03795 [Candidatus Eisenbacteria bacterium]|uniref:Uncharacterized protein n=1 Tax=Eiseniibacteriota bacterium TaxID=2212470 RepID=A0ABV6YK38_UNCEI